MQAPAVLNAAELRGLLASPNPPRIIDVRTPGEFETVHIGGAYNVPLDLLREHRDEIRAHLDEHVVLVCQSGQRATQAEEALRLLKAQDFFEGCQVQGIESVPEQDWVRLTQSQFAPVSITEDFWIVPTWHEPPVQARKVIRLDPGLAFGTGTHPTTRMCLRWIASHADALGRVLDYGCGSGILAIGAAKYGAKDIDAVDIDPAAVVSTQLNAQANDVSLKVGMPELASERYNTVLANILATPLKVLAPLLSARLISGGHLVLAGILDRQAEELKQAYAPYVSLEVADQEEGWILMTGRTP